jgi:hypothetical protein
MGEAIQAGMDPQKYCDILNKNLEERERKKASNLDDDDRKFAVSEAIRAGMDMSTDEARQKIFSSYDKHSKAPDPVEEERLSIEEEARQFIEIYESQNPGKTFSLDMVREMVIADRKKKAEEEAKQGRMRLLVNEMMLSGAPRKLSEEEQRIRDYQQRMLKK